MLKTIQDATELTTFTAGLKTTAQLAAALQTPFDKMPAFDAAKNPEIDATAKLAKDRKLMRCPVRRLFRDYRSNPDAYKQLDPLPGPGQTLHGVIGGTYALFDQIPALIERTGSPIAELYACTLGLSKSNGTDLMDMIDAGQIGRLTLILSHYFLKSSRDIYDAVVPGLLERGQRVKCLRSHAKIIAVRMRSGAAYVSSSSANLRSCKNIEQFELTRCPRLYAFHRRWIEEEIFRDVSKGRKAEHYE